VDDEFVGRMPIAEPRGDMRMQVDGDRRDQSAAGIEHRLRRAGRNIGFQRLDQAVADAVVTLAAQ